MRTNGRCKASPDPSDEIKRLVNDSEALRKRSKEISRLSERLIARSNQVSDRARFLMSGPRVFAAG